MYPGTQGGTGHAMKRWDRPSSLAFTTIQPKQPTATIYSQPITLLYWIFVLQELHLSSQPPRTQRFDDCWTV